MIFILLNSARGRIGTIVIGLLFLMALFAPVVAPYDPIAMDPTVGLMAPSRSHLLGTDIFGRDLLSRIIWGSRISLGISVASVLLATVSGSLVGILAGYFGGTVDNVIMRITDILFAFPSLILAIAVVAFLGSSDINVAIALGIVYAPILARVARSAALVVKNQLYIEAARSVGSTEFAIVRYHILPNVVAPVIVQATLCFAYAILAEAGLSFLGLGPQPPRPSWGRMLSEGRMILGQAPWHTVFPGLIIMIAVLGFNILGDALRDVLDPRLRIMR